MSMIDERHVAFYYIVVYNLAVVVLSVCVAILGSLDDDMMFVVKVESKIRVLAV